MEADGRLPDESGAHRQRRGRPRARQCGRRRLERAGRHATGYDATITGDDPDPTAFFPRWDDPFSAALTAPVKGALYDLYARIGWKPDLEYHLGAGVSWQWGNSSNGVESMTQVMAALALDPKFATNDARVKNQDELDAIIGRWTRARHAASATGWSGRSARRWTRWFRPGAGRR